MSPKRRELSEILVGGAVVVTAALFILGAFRDPALTDVDGYGLSIEVRDASGLAAGSEVRLAGIKVGQVVSQTIDPKSFMAVVALRIDDGIELPLDTSARILPEGLVGRSYVELEPGGEEDLLVDGDAITFAQGAINAVDLLGRIILSGERNIEVEADAQSDW
jgi:phospholipid/cholesterol/gamma-HCH transport system substrate-binding protein